MSLLDDVSIVVTPNGYKAGELYAVVPVPTEGAEILSQPVDLVTDFSVNSGGVIVDADTFTTAGGLFDGIRKNSFLTLGKRYKLTIEGDTTSSGFTIGDTAVSGNEYGTDFGTFYFTAVGNGSLWIRQQTSGTTNLTSFTLKEYTSADMDVTRATAATRVDEDGLVNYAEIVGSEDVTNGDFTELPLGTGWDAYTSGSSTVAFTEGAILSIDSINSNVGVYQQNIFTSGVQYKIVLNIKATASFDALVSETDAASSKGTIGTLSLTTSYQDFSFYYTGTGDWDLFIHRKFGETAGQSQQVYIKDVSVKEVTRDNVPRIDYTGGGCPHILAEPQRTNLVTYSEDFSNSAWTKSNSTIATTTETVSPDGTENASKLTVIAVQYSGLYKTLDAASNKYSMSIFAKKGDKDWLYFIDGAGTTSVAWFNISDGTLGTITNGTATINNFGNGWYRCTYSDTNNNSNVYFQIGLADANNSNTPSSGGHSYIWGADKEVGSFPTSYIPTSGSTVTRNKDQFTRDGIGSLINSTEGTFFLEMAALSNDGTFRQISLNDATNNNMIQIDYTSTDNQIRGVVVSGGVLVANLPFILSDATLSSKIALKYKNNDFSLWVNGVEVSVDSSGVTPTNLSALFLSNGGGTNNFFGKVKQLQVYKTALTDEQLIQLTGTSGTDFYESYAEMASALTYTIQ